LRAVAYHRQAKRYLERIPEKRAVQVMDCVNSLAALDNPARDAGVKVMSGDWQGWMRTRIGSYRAIFRIQAGQNGNETLFVLIVGPRGDLY